MHLGGVLGIGLDNLLAACIYPVSELETNAEEWEI